MGATTLELPVTLPGGDDCERCAGLLRARLHSLRGVQEAELLNAAGTLRVTYDPDILTLARIEAEACRIGATIAEEIGHDALALEDLDCPNCAESIEKSVAGIPGVLWARTNFAAGQLQVEYERAHVSLQAVREAAEAHGVRACPVRPLSTGETAGDPADARRTTRWWPHRRTWDAVASGGLAACALWASSRGWAGPSVALYVASIAVGGWPTARAAWRSVRARSLDMNVLMTLAVLGAAAIGEWFEGATVVVLYSVGNLLQAHTMERTRRSLRALMDLSPATARVVRPGEAGDAEVPLEALRVGDVVRILPGERVPVDGEVTAGASTVNQAPVTGESVPVDKHPGDTVFAGTLNVNGSLEARATRRFRDTTLARIVHSVEEAQAQRAPTQQFIDAFARVYTPLVVGGAAVVAFAVPAALWGTAVLNGRTPVAGTWEEWFFRALGLLLVACPCALVISTPVAVVAAIGAASRRGALVKGGAHLETLGQVRAVLYDKTGTLTQGAFRADEVVPLDGIGSAQVLRIAAALEAHSTHPLAAAVLDAAARAGAGPLPEVTGFEAAAGYGISGTVEGRTYRLGSPAHAARSGIDMDGIGPVVSHLQERGHTVAVLADGGRPIAAVGLADVVRPEAAPVIAALRALGIRAQAMLTGDNAGVAAAIAGTVGLSDFRAGLLPADKLRAVHEYRSAHGKVAMVGDGINDAPALAAADVGIVMGAMGSDTAMDTADVALMADDLSRLPWLVALGRRTRRIIAQNVAFALATKGALVVAAVFVGLPLWLAIAGDVGVSLLVTLNALRLARA